VCFTCYLSDRTMPVWAVFWTLHRLKCFQHYALTMVNHWQGIQNNQICRFFSSKWFKPPRDHFLFGNSLRNSYAVYCFSSQTTFIKCLSSTENSIVFIIINSNNPMSQIITSSQSKNGSVVLGKFNNWVGNCQHNLCAKKNFKIKITMQVMMRKLLDSFVDTV